MATLLDLQQKNRRKTNIIVICFVLFFLWLGVGLDLALYYLKGTRADARYQRSHAQPTATYASPPTQRKPFYPLFGGLIGLVGAGVAWWSVSNASGTILRTMMAKPARRENSPAEQVLINIVEEMSIASGMPPPSVWVIPDTDPNALATGMKDGDYHIAVTQGLLHSLNRDELQAVVAHEIAHLKNSDTRLMTTMTVLVGMAALISEFVARVRFFRVSGGSSSDRNSSDTRIGAIILVLWLLTALLAPVVTRLMTMMVSREREYLADASAAQFTRNPEALARALEKIGYAAAPTKLVKPASAHLCIASPEAADLEPDESWFATHPPIRKRIDRLRSLAGASAFQNTIPMRY
ncbi:MAG: zinc metalloprotease HtpX [Oxalobacter sp.]|nr:MAG: zinc metalloprotease HtpX [Oxalobacter sp.]